MTNKDLRKGVYQEGVYPTEYHVVLTPNLDAWTCDAVTVIEIVAKSPIDFVDLNAYNLKNLKAYNPKDVRTGLRPEDECSIEIDPDGLDRKKDRRIRVLLPQPTMGVFYLLITSRATINQKLEGLYKSFYDTGNKNLGAFATSQCEEWDLCQIFPAFDRPAAKAVFRVKAVIPADIKAIFNMLVKSEKNIGDLKLVEFEDTPKMSTYLLFFAFGHFDILIDKIDPRFRAITVPGKIEYAKYALEFMRKSVQHCERYTGVAYPLPKLDIIGVPEFQFGAMENWGVLAHRENLMLYYPGSTGLNAEKSICEVIAHEVAHQWFGNLVSPMDWQYVWLNETLATYFGNDISQKLNPNWAIWDSFLRADYKDAMDRDACLYDFPVQLPDGLKLDISTSTAPIIYSKGGCIYRQLVGFMGEETLRKALGHYLSRYAYDNTVTEDFYSALSESSGQPVRDLMQSWIEQVGYPIIGVKRTGRRLVLTQRRFTYLPNESPDIWNIPLTYRVWQKDGAVTDHACVFKDQTIMVNLPEDCLAYKLNIEQTGFYRVKYPAADLKTLTELANAGKLCPKDAFSLENDAFALLMSGDMKTGAYLRLFRKLITEKTPFLPLIAAMDNLVELLRLKKHAEHGRKITALGKKTAESSLALTGYEPKEGEPETVTILRNTMIARGAIFGSKKIMEFAREKFASLLTGKRIHANIRAGILSAIATENNQTIFDRLTDMFRKTTSENERMEILRALGSFSDPEIIRQIWNFTISEVPQANKFLPLSNLGYNPNAPETLFDLYADGLEKFLDLPKINHERIIMGVFKNWQNADTARIDRFFSDLAKKHEELDDIVKYAGETLKIENRIRHELD
ncbi:MAG: M1 family metallopeptidase [Candidatus Falkowbacteria bacterium]